MRGRVRPLTVWVPGRPRPQGSHRIVVGPNGRARVIDSAGRALADWRETVALAVRAKARSRFIGPVHVAAIFYLPKPKRSAPPFPATRPDLDKLTRALLDGLTASGAVADDGQVVDIAVSKRWAEREPGCYLRIREVNP